MCPVSRVPIPCPVTGGLSSSACRPATGGLHRLSGPVSAPCVPCPDPVSRVPILPTRGRWSAVVCLPTRGRWSAIVCVVDPWPVVWSASSVLGLGNLGGKRHPSTNNIPLSFPKLKDSFPFSQMQWLVVNQNFCDILSILIFELLIR